MAGAAAAIATLITVVLVMVVNTGSEHANPPSADGNQTAQTALPDAATLVKQSADTTKNVKSAHLVLSINGKIPGLPIKTQTVDLTTTPATAASGNATFTIGGSDIQADFVVVDGELYATLTPNKWSDFGRASDIYDVSAILSPDTGVANILANFTDPTVEGRDIINGLSTIRLSGYASADSVNKVAPAFKATQPVSATVWIQETGDHQLARVSLEKSPGNSLLLILSNWGEQVQVTKPAVG